MYDIAHALYTGSTFSPTDILSSVSDSSKGVINDLVNVVDFSSCVFGSCIVTIFDFCFEPKPSIRLSYSILLGNHLEACFGDTVSCETMNEAVHINTRFQEYYLPQQHAFIPWIAWSSSASLYSASTGAGCSRSTSAKLSHCSWCSFCCLVNNGKKTEEYERKNAKSYPINHLIFVQCQLPGLLFLFCEF